MNKAAHEKKRKEDHSALSPAPYNSRRAISPPKAPLAIVLIWLPYKSLRRQTTAWASALTTLSRTDFRHPKPNPIAVTIQFYQSCPTFSPSLLPHLFLDTFGSVPG
jgi:hypothetical protein